MSALSLTAAGCTGSIDRTPASGTSPGPEKPGESGPKGTAGMSGTEPSNSGPPPKDAVQGDEVLPGPRLWKLSAVQYANSVAALVGVDVKTLPAIPEDGFTGRFDTSSETDLSVQQASAYREIAELAAPAGVTRAMAKFPCLGSAAPGATCVRDFLKSVLGEAWRAAQPDTVLAKYEQRFSAFAKNHGTPAAVRLVYEAALQSPNFIYRTELGTPAGGGVRQLTGAELATQLAYVLTDRPPSAALLQAAERGELDEPQALAAQAKAIVETDPNFRAKLVAFFAQHLEVRRIDSAGNAKDDDAFKAIKPLLQEETKRFVEAVIFEEGGTLETLLTAGHTYGTPELASHYGGTHATGKGWGKITFSGGGRAGLLTQASVMAALAHGAETSPIKRGVFVAVGLLCRATGDPDPTADLMKSKLVRPGDGWTAREHWEYAKGNPDASGCVGCHQGFHPLGLAFETFDGLGRFRMKEHDKTIDTSGELLGISGPEGGAFTDAQDLGRRIARSEEGRACFAGQLGSYLFGRALTPLGRDQSWSRGVLADSGGSALDIKKLTIAMTQRPSFRFRKEQP